MKTTRILRIVLALLVMALATEVAFRLNLWNIRGVQASDVYYRYKDTPGVNAAYIKDYRVNDTLTISATVLEITTDSTWDELCDIFNIIIFPDNEIAIKNNRDVLSLLHGENCNNCGMTANEIAVASLRDRYICIFHNVDHDFKDYIIDAVFDIMYNSITNNQNFITNEENN